MSRTAGVVAIERIAQNTRVGVEVFGFGSPCVMLGGQCALASYATGSSVNACGACAPGTCKGRYDVVGRAYHVLDQPGVLNALDLVPALKRIGVAAVRIDAARGEADCGATATRLWRAALDSEARRAGAPAGRPQLPPELQRLARPGQLSLGSYSEPWQ